MTLARGTIVLLDLDPATGHEQRGTRPCVVVSDPEITEDQRFPVVAVVPVTGTPALGALYPHLAPGPSGLTKPSCALIDQLRSVDKRRIRRIYGRVSVDELRAIDDGLLLFLGLEGDETPAEDADTTGGDDLD
jgi:mRNA interferase MazF